LTYSNHIENIEISPYIKRTIKKLKIVDLNAADVSAEYRSFNYEFKYQDRTLINSFLTGIDDISDILIVKNGSLTDTSFSNIILFDGEKWITPSTFLLNGVKRRYLLENNKIAEEKVSLDDIGRFQKISLINAMLDPEDIEVDIFNVEF
jgi:4-amino-4-deoxychorismate lyase